MSARARFYADAGANQMPIRRVSMYWTAHPEVDAIEADEITSLNGKYKNSKPLCDGSDFGNSDAACKKGYYQYINNYSFYDCDGDASKLYTVGVSAPPVTSNGLTFVAPDYGFEIGDRYCAFKPRIQILDNWGWCNGSCESGVGGCWNSPENQECKDYLNFLNASTPFNGWIIIKEAE